MTTHLALFVGVSVLVICTPGPDTALTIRNSMFGGYRSGLGVAAGVALGQLIWAAVAASGLAGLLQASRPAFEVIQLAGAVYMVFLGVQSWRAAWRGPRSFTTGPPIRRWSLGCGVWQGLVNDLANPKIAAFFLGLLPQVASTQDLGTFLALGALFAMMTFVWLSGYVLLLHRARNTFQRRRVRRSLDAVCGTALLALGAKIAVDSAQTA